MATTEFHCFLSLPLEIRREIYTLATPPRIVHVNPSTKQDYNDFKEKLRTEPNCLRLDKALTHFSFNWRKQIPAQGRHRTLESYGFSSNKPPYTPWEVSKSAPRICLYWLAENPRIAWELARESYLYSKAPIPALLHTWSESRHELMQRGYQLSFRTRSSGPRTWFNYDRDILFISREPFFQSHHRVLSGGPWDLSQFDPGDMCRVKKIALERSAGSLHLAHPMFKKLRYTFGDIVSVLRLFEQIKEFFLVEWTDEHMRELRESEGLYAHEYFEKHHGYDIQGLWSYQIISEIDALLELFAPRGSWRCSLVSIAPWVESLELGQNLGTPYFIDKIQVALQEQLSDRRKRAYPTSKWKIPMFKTVHILSKWGHEVLGQHRSRILRQIHERREKWLLQNEWMRYINVPSQDLEVDYEEDEQADEDALFEYSQNSVLAKRRRTWWIQKGITLFFDASNTVIL
ncbi:hypothetical protein FSARC_11802 [Fusarium sarcochroum]|uniref:2EXR domain-containing protein n=1 Tax=Fusarium sarcochroum TaxID=1208366 RepID=A0A8H4WZM2_9HYPO|nr:hypothetical protein FSARC_11802 [Fusarium sarcochroum]